MRIRRSPAAWGLLAALLVFILDQASKWWLLEVVGIDRRPPIEVTPFFDLVMVWNTGISFGLFAEHDQRLLLVRRQRERTLDAEKRFVVATKLHQDLAMIGECIGGSGIELKRRANELQRLVALSALVIDDAEQMHGVEMSGRELEDAGIESFRVVKQSPPVQCDAGFDGLINGLLLGSGTRSGAGRLCC